MTQAERLATAPPIPGDVRSRPHARARRIFAWSATVVLALAAGFVLFAIGVEPAAPTLVPRAANGPAVALSAEPPWTVMVLGDVQAGFRYLPELRRIGTENGADAFVILGDLATQPNPAHLQLPVRELQATPAPAPLFAVPGNHDIVDAASRRSFEKWFGGVEFEFRLGDTWFVGLDNAQGPVSDAGVSRLASRLDRAESEGLRVVLCMHHSPIQPTEAWRDPRGGADENPALLELVHSGRLATVLAGHAHQPYTEWRNGTEFRVVRAAGDTNDGQIVPVSYLVLRGDPSGWTSEEHMVLRDPRIDLEGQVFHAALAHLAPLLRGAPFESTPPD